jgi:DNA gyrase subunit A
MDDSSTAATGDQVEAIIRGARLRLASAQERAHILSAILRVVERYDDLVAIMRSSETVDEGRQRVAGTMGLDQVQTRAVTGITVGMLTHQHHGWMVAEHDELLTRIPDLEALLASPERQHELIGTERGNELANYTAAE